MRNLLILATVAAAVAGTAPAGAATITATLTADNHYGLYTGNKDGTDLTRIGRNELGFEGSAGAYNWSQAETFSNFAVSPGDYLYVVAWNDGPFSSSGNPQMWIGSFAGSNGKTVVSDASWQYLTDPGVVFSPGVDPASGGAPLPSIGELTGLIKAGGFAAIAGGAIGMAPNGTGPWNTIAGVNSAAQFIWSDTLQAGSPTDTHYVIFREDSPFVAGVPELSTWAMMIIGFGGVGFQLRRRGNPAAATA